MFLDLTTTTYRSFFEIPDRWIASVSQDWVQPTDWHKQAFDLSHFHCKRKTSSVQFSGLVMSDSLRPHGLQHARPSLSITNSWSLLKLMSIELVMPCSHLILCQPLLLPPSIFPSIRVFSNESVLHIRWPKYWSFSFNISPSNEHPGLVFRMDWLDLHAVQGSQESSPNPQSKSINSSVLNFLHSPTLTFIHDHWKNHSLD